MARFKRALVVVLDTLVAAVNLLAILATFATMLYITQPGSPIQGSTLHD